MINFREELHETKKITKQRNKDDRIFFIPESRSRSLKREEQVDPFKEADLLNGSLNNYKK